MNVKTLSYRRQIEPVRTFEGESHPMLRRQFHWNDSDGISLALYAGKEMM